MYSSGIYWLLVTNAEENENKLATALQRGDAGMPNIGMIDIASINKSSSAKLMHDNGGK